jgi:REP element-mobilizing transposase RayT
MAYVRIWLHCVWGTKNRVHFLTGRKKYDIISHILSYTKSKGIYIDLLDGHDEHLHCLLRLKCDQTIAYVMQMIKGESSYWINKNRITNYRFEWADEYYCVSVSESAVPEVRKYIKNQEEHHRKKSWDMEYEELMKQYGSEMQQG